MPDEFGEHLTRDQRPFLYTESLKLLLFSSVHSSGLVTGAVMAWKLHFVGNTFILCVLILMFDLDRCPDVLKPSQTICLDVGFFFSF